MRSTRRDMLTIQTYKEKSVIVIALRGTNVADEEWDLLDAVADDVVFGEPRPQVVFDLRNLMAELTQSALDVLAVSFSMIRASAGITPRITATPGKNWELLVESGFAEEHPIREDLSDALRIF
jgi:hypothetical protein